MISNDFDPEKINDTIDQIKDIDIPQIKKICEKLMKLVSTNTMKYNLFFYYIIIKYTPIHKKIFNNLLVKDVEGKPINGPTKAIIMSWFSIPTNIEEYNILFANQPTTTSKSARSVDIIFLELILMIDWKTIYNKILTEIFNNGEFNLISKMQNYIRFKQLEYNCKIRRMEGYFINNSLKQMQSFISNFLIEKQLTNEIKPIVYSYPNITFNNKINCNNNNYLFNNQYKIFSETQKNVSPESGIIMKTIFEDENDGFKLEKKNTTMVIFTIINLGNIVNNPPTPPYINTNTLKQIYNMLYYIINNKNKNILKFCVKITDKITYYYYKFITTLLKYEFYNNDLKILSKIIYDAKNNDLESGTDIREVEFYIREIKPIILPVITNKEDTVENTNGDTVENTKGDIPTIIEKIIIENINLLKNDTISDIEQYYTLYINISTSLKTLIDIIETNNASTLIGTLEFTKYLQPSDGNTLYYNCDQNEYNFDYTFGMSKYTN